MCLPLAAKTWEPPGCRFSASRPLVTMGQSGSACLSGEQMRKILSGVACSLMLVALQATATPVVINTMPAIGDSTGVESTIASFQWFDLAAGFNVPTFGRVTHITAALTTRDVSFGGFVVGLASSLMVGNPASPSYFDPPPGSLWETRVCSPSSRQGLTRTACQDDALAKPSSPRIALTPGDYFDVAVDIYLPAAGTYWLYTRFDRDDVFAGWTKNRSIDTELIARRTGICAGSAVGSCERLDDRTFFQVTALEAAPGLRVVYEPGLRIPEPAPYTLMFLALGALWLAVRRRKGRSG